MARTNGRLTVLTNGTVLTMNPAQPVAEALAVRNGRIAAVGSRAEIQQIAGRDSRAPGPGAGSRDSNADAPVVIDLAGRIVMPGFVDPHNHFSIGALESFWADCRKADRIAEIQQRMAATARATPPGEWVRALGYDHHDLAERRHPTRHDLDAAVPDRPAFLLHFSHHQGVANSRALAEAGIARGTPDVAGGEIGRDKSGEPNGLLFERAMSLVERRSREGWEARFVDVARAATLAYAAHGITTIEDAAVTPDMARRYAEARAAGALAIRVEEMMVGSRGWFERPDDAAPGRTLKLFTDGGYRCAMRLARDSGVVESGFLFYERAEMTDLIVRALRQGQRVTCHAIGNRGVERAIESIGDALRLVPEDRDRVRIDHAIFLTGDLIRRLADLGVPVVGQPCFLYDVGGTPLPSPELARRPFATLARAGIRQAFSSDFPCGSLAPLVGVYAAVTRRTEQGVLETPEEAVTVGAALEAYTSGAARAAGLAEACGSLEVGKRADLVVLSGNPLETPPYDMLSLTVLETWVGGAPVVGRNAP